MDMLPKHSLIKRDNCRLCKGGLEDMFSFTPTPPGDHYLPEKDFVKSNITYPLDVVLCKECNLLQLAHTVNPEILYKDYIYLTSNSLGLVKHFEEYARGVVADMKIPKKSLVIDVGCNDGTLLHHFKEQGMKTLGIEPASKAAKITKEKGIPVIEEFLTPDVAERVVQKYGKASVITANNVLANIDSPGEIIGNIKKMLSPGGVFVFETGYALDTINNNVFDNFYHEHLSYFSVKPLESFFRTEDMEMVDVKPLPTKGGSIRGFVQFKKNIERRVSSSVKHHLNLEEKMHMDQRKTFRSFYKRVKKEGDRIKEAISKLEGNKIAGYGASVGVTTMLYEWGIGDSLDFLVDDNPFRQGLFSPGFKIPVKSSEAIYSEHPAAIVILAWRYSYPIINKHKKYLGQGGRFIIPFPDIIRKF